MKLKPLLIALGYGGVSGALTAAVLAAMEALSALLWQGTPSPWRSFFTILAGGVLIALLRVLDGGDEPDLAAQVRQARAPQELHRRQAALLAAMAIVAVAFGGAVGPEAGTLAVVAELSALVALAIGRSADERALIGEVGATGALGALYGSPPGGLVVAEGEPAAPPARDEATPHRALLLLAGVAGLGGFYLAWRALSHGGAMRVQLPPYVVADSALDLLPAVLPALLGGLAGLAFVTLLPRLRRLLARCGGVVVQTLVGSLAFAALAATWPILRDSGHHQLDALLAWGRDAGWAALLLLAALKVLALSLCLASGWRGGAIFPLIFAGAAAGGAALAIQPQANPTLALVAGIAAAATVGIGKPAAALLIVALLIAPLAPGPLLVGALVGYGLARLGPPPSLH